MALTEAAFALWVLNCLIASVLAYFFGWSIAAAVVIAAWIGIAVLGVSASFVDSAQDNRSYRRRAAYVLKDAVAILGMVVAVLAFPGAMLVLAARERFLESTPDVGGRESIGKGGCHGLDG